MTIALAGRGEHGLEHLHLFSARKRHLGDRDRWQRFAADYRLAFLFAFRFQHHVPGQRLKFGELVHLIIVEQKFYNGKSVKLFSFFACRFLGCLIITSVSDIFILTERREAVAVLTLNRPEKLNALSPKLLSELADKLEELNKDEKVRVCILTGGPKVFAAGADIDSMAKASPVDIYLRNTRALWQRIWLLDKPVIAAVNGVAFGGGCELALSCDLIVAGSSALFGQPEIKLGIMPGAGGTQRLTRAIGPYRAMELVLTGEPITAQQALEFGLVSRVVSDEKVLDEALALAKLIAERPPVAVRLARQAVRFGAERTLLEGLELERRNYRMLYDTHDQKEGMAAFLEKRQPRFKGH